MAVRSRLVSVTTIPTMVSSPPTDRHPGSHIRVIVPSASAGQVRFGGANLTWNQGFSSDQVDLELDTGEQLYAIVQNTPVTITVIEDGV